MIHHYLELINMTNNRYWFDGEIELFNGRYESAVYDNANGLVIEIYGDSPEIVMNKIDKLLNKNK